MSEAFCLSLLKVVINDQALVFYIVITFKKNMPNNSVLELLHITIGVMVWGGYQ